MSTCLISLHLSLTIHSLFIFLLLFDYPLACFICSHSMLVPWRFVLRGHSLVLTHATYYQTPYWYSFSCFGSQVVTDSKGAWGSGSIKNGSDSVLSWVLAYMFVWSCMFVFDIPFVFPHLDMLFDCSCYTSFPHYPCHPFFGLTTHMTQKPQHHSTAQHIETWLDLIGLDTWSVLHHVATPSYLNLLLCLHWCGALGFYKGGSSTV